MDIEKLRAGVWTELLKRCASTPHKEWDKVVALVRVTKDDLNAALEAYATLSQPGMAGWRIPEYGDLTCKQQDDFATWLSSIMKKGSIHDWADLPTEFKTLWDMLSASPMPVERNEVLEEAANVAKDVAAKQREMRSMPNVDEYMDGRYETGAYVAETIEAAIRAKALTATPGDSP